MKRRLNLLLVAIFLFVGAFMVLSPSTLAATNDCPTGWDYVDASGPGQAHSCCPPNTGGDPTQCLFAKYVNPAVKMLSALAGIAAVIGIVIGGIQYASSSGDPQKAAAGKGKIIKALYGLFAFLFLYSALQFMSPGGISSNPKPTRQGSTIAQQCSKSFLGVKPWYYYLPDDAFPKSGDSCDIENFSLFGENNQKSQLLPVVVAIADILVRIAGFVAVAFVIIGGIQYITSQGEPERTKHAKDSIINALIGLAMAIIAAAIVSFIGDSLS